MNGVLGTGTLTVQTGEIAHLIQVALTPIFLISAIGVTLNVLTNRLSRIVDRARSMEDHLRRPDYQFDGRDLHSVLGVMARRARYINAAITLITLSALFISLVVVMLFVNAFLRWDLLHRVYRVWNLHQSELLVQAQLYDLEALDVVDVRVQPALESPVLGEPLDRVGL